MIDHRAGELPAPSAGVVDAHLRQGAVVCSIVGDDLISAQAVRLDEHCVVQPKASGAEAGEVCACRQRGRGSGAAGEHADSHERRGAVTSQSIHRDSPRLGSLYAVRSCRATDPLHTRGPYDSSHRSLAIGHAALSTAAACRGLMQPRRAARGRRLRTGLPSAAQPAGRRCRDAS